MFSLVLSGIILGLSVAAPIGPVNVAVIRRGLVSGFFPAWMLGLGAAAADTFYVILVFLGLAPILAASIPFRFALWLIGGAFLIYLGVTSALQSTQCDASVRVRVRPRVIDNSVSANSLPEELHPFLSGLGMTLLNPMTIISWLAIGGAFFSTLALVERGTFGGAVFVAGIFLGSALWFSGIAMALHFARRWVNDRALQLVSRIASLALIAFGASFIWQAVQVSLPE